MKAILHFSARLAGIVALLGLVGCGGGERGLTPALLPAELLVPVGANGTVLVSNPPRGAAQVDSWVTSNDSVVTVAASGTWTAAVTGVAAGTATVTATMGSVSVAATVTVVVDALSQPTQEQLASFLTAEAQAGRFSPVPTLKPVPLTADDSLRQAMANDLGPARLVAITVDTAVFATIPVVITPGDLTVAAVGSRGTPVPDVQIEQDVGRILDKMEGLGMDTSTLRDAYQSTDFYPDGAGNVAVPSDAGGVTFTAEHTFWGEFVVWGSYMVFNSSDMSHTFLKAADVQNLRNGEIVQNNTLSGSALTALHEMIHTAVFQTGCGVDDKDDQVVTKLGAVLKAKIDIELSRQPNGTADSTRVANYSRLVREAQDLGGECCLVRVLGLPGSARNLCINAPKEIEAGSTYWVQISAEKTDGSPLAKEDVYVHISGSGVSAPSTLAVRTNNSGWVSVAVTAGAPMGVISVSAEVLGASGTATIAVVE